MLRRSQGKWHKKTLKSDTKMEEQAQSNNIFNFSMYKNDDNNFRDSYSRKQSIFG